ncbi:MAG: metal-sensitive transcriptional regulator [Firmicutes bacterium]|nr:metal-sensitive transcriptional regulator [Bacillota bacterium]
MENPKKKDAFMRLRTAGGHLKAIERMLEEDQYCADILLQLHAVIASLKKISDIILENHLETCIREAIQRGEEDLIVRELKTFMKYKA